MKKIITEILERNQKVELDKKWELSLTRKIFIALIIYFFSVLFLAIIKTENFFKASIIPTSGYLFSTFSLNPIRSIWEKFQ